MVDRQRDHEPIIQNFRKWLRDNSASGTLGQTETVNTQFMPSQRLDTWLKEANNTRNLLRALWPEPDDVPVQPKEIWGKCSKGFATLLLIGKGHFIQHFIKHDSLWDGQMPFNDCPSNFPTTGDDPNFFKKFAECQWQFFPHTFLPDVIDIHLNLTRILPIAHKELLAPGGFADTYKIQLHQAYDLLTTPLDQRRVSMIGLQPSPHDEPPVKLTGN